MSTLRVWLAAVVTIGVGTVVGLSAVPVAGSFVGAFLGAFLLGVVVEDRPLVPAAAAAVVARLGVIAAPLLVASAGLLPPVASLDPVPIAVSLALTAAVGAFGAHFGDDLRAGLTEPVGTARPAGGGRPASEEPSDASVEPSADEPVRADHEPSDDEPTNRELEFEDG